MPDSPLTATWAVTTGQPMWRTTISADSQCRLTTRNDCAGESSLFTDFYDRETVTAKKLSVERPWVAATSFSKGSNHGLIKALALQIAAERHYRPRQ
nr:hypothetical protein Iba_chr02eCG5600 [Ipomoea batatas]